MIFFEIIPSASPVGTKTKVEELNKASNVADQDSSQPSGFVGKEREKTS